MTEADELRQAVIERLKPGAGGSVLNNTPDTPLEETIQKTVVPPATSSDPYALPDLNAGLAHRLGISEKKAEASNDTRKAVIEKTMDKFNKTMELL